MLQKLLIRKYQTNASVRVTVTEYIFVFGKNIHNQKAEMVSIQLNMTRHIFVSVD